jgi:hypothetical protein
LKPIRERDKTASRLTRAPGQGGAADLESNMVLRKMYKLMSSSYQADIQRRELSENRQEEQDLEEERRHKELLEALGHKKPSATLINVQKTESLDTDSLFGRVKSMIDTATTGLKVMVELMFAKALTWVADSLKSFMGNIKSWTKTLVTKLGEGLIKAISLLRGLLTPIIAFLTNPLVLSAIAFGAAMYGYEQWGKTVNGLKAQLNRNNVDLSNLKTQLDYLSPTLNGRENPEYTKKKSIYDTKMKERELLTTKLQTLESVPPKEDKSTWDMIKNFGNSFDTSKLDNELKSSTSFGMPDLNLPDIKAPKLSFGDSGPMPSAPQTATSIPMAMPAAPAVVATPKIDTSASADNSKPTSKLNSVVSENVNKRMASGPLIRAQKTQNTTNISNTQKATPIKKPLPSVRNHEESFQRMIFDSTRVV